MAFWAGDSEPLMWHFKRGIPLHTLLHLLCSPASQGTIPLKQETDAQVFCRKKLNLNGSHLREMPALVRAGVSLCFYKVSYEKLNLRFHLRIRDSNLCCSLSEQRLWNSIPTECVNYWSHKPVPYLGKEKHSVFGMSWCSGHACFWSVSLSDWSPRAPSHFSLD